MKMARNPATTWEMLNVAISHFQDHIGAKSDLCSLSIVDLLNVSNFKGGNASITEPVETLSSKLTFYEDSLKEIQKIYAGKSLSSLSESEKNNLISHCNRFLSLTADDETKIRGFGPSYASALLSAHFIELIPVLDRRALNGADIEVVKDSQGQVKNLSIYYGRLIDAFWQKLSETPEISLRELDKKWFSKEL